MEKTYLSKLAELKAVADALPRTPMMARARISALTLLNMRYDQIMLDRALGRHPYELTAGFVDDAVAQLRGWAQTAAIEAPGTAMPAPAPEPQEERHQELFQHLWTRFSIDEYKERIQRFEHRLDVNDLAPLLRGRRCIDFGCGHGNFDHALLNRGAAFALGLDFGEESILYAERVRDALGVDAARLAFKTATVYETGEPSESYDFALQNGVFHHLDDEDAAYREVCRVLKPGGWFWIFTDGAGSISCDLWDASREILADIHPAFISHHLEHLNISVGKRLHMGDSFTAKYRRTTWEAFTQRLAGMGFGNFRRLMGGFDTDRDLDIIAADRYGAEKFGTGSLRVLCQKL